ncbi:MAG: hypothetical protein R3C18_17555 [Planctomycetaceae bacterium]
MSGSSAPGACCPEVRTLTKGRHEGAEFVPEDSGTNTNTTSENWTHWHWPVRKSSTAGQDLPVLHFDDTANTSERCSVKGRDD